MSDKLSVSEGIESAEVVIMERCAISERSVKEDLTEKVAFRQRQKERQLLP